MDFFAFSIFMPYLQKQENKSNGKQADSGKSNPDF